MTKKNYLGKIGEFAFYAILASPFVLSLEIPIYRAYKSGFVKAYNQAVDRNADLNHDGRIEQKEILKIKQILLEEIIELNNRGKDFEDIVGWLEKR